MNVNMLWNDGKESDWKAAITEYYDNSFVRKHIDLENRMESLSPSDVRNMSDKEFYLFLRDEYFVWKYTAPNRLATTRKSLAEYETEGLEALGKIKLSIFNAYDRDPEDSEALLKAAKQIKGLGTAGASGLLAIMFPKEYGTVDQFLVYSLLKIPTLKEYSRIKGIKNPQVLSIKDAVILENILRDKACELNKKFNSDEWTPRKIDMILWAVDRG